MECKSLAGLHSGTAAPPVFQLALGLTLKHALAHDAGRDALRGAAHQVIDRASLAPCSDLQVLTEVLLIDDTGQRPPFAPQFMCPGSLMVMPSGAR